MLDRTISAALPIFFLLIFAACGGRLYKVAPLPVSAPPEVSTNNAGGLNIGARVLDGDQSYERFEANLPLAGVIAVDVRMINRSDVTIRTNSLRFDLRDVAGSSLKHLAPKKALSSVMKYYGNSFYAKAAYRRTLGDYESVALKQEGAIEPGGDIRGILFFKTTRETKSVDGLTLSVAGLAAPVNLQLQTARDSGGLR
ncbi:MAG: hypothetical protein AB7U82_15215 [Blastocatellales bacterium]